MSGKKLLTIFGATGNQGGSIISTVLSNPSLSAKYALRGITRDPSSTKSAALASKGVELAKANVDDLESLKAAIKGSYGVFGVTDFWNILDKQREIRQGKNIFEASKDVGVKHLVFSSLPSAEKITNGELKKVEHFDSKAEVYEYIEANKGDMVASYFQPAMFFDAVKQMTNPGQDGKLILALPFPSDSIAWPLLEPRIDTGKFVVGLFEGGDSANGIVVNGVSSWTTPKEVVTAMSEASGKEVVFAPLPAEVFAGFLTENIRDELTEMMVFIGKWNYYGKGQENGQEKSDRWLVGGMKTVGVKEWAEKNKL